MGLFDFFKSKKDNVENDVLPPNMFICDVCKRTLQVSCRHHANLCDSCANIPTQPKNHVCSHCKKEITDKETKWIGTHRFCGTCYDSKNTTRVESVQKEPIGNDNDKSKEASLFLGDFAINESDRKRIGASAIKYLPKDMDTVEAQLSLIDSLEPVMDLFVTKTQTETVWRIAKCQGNKESFNEALAMTIATANSSLSYLNPEYLKYRVASASIEQLLKAWIILDYYNYVSISTYTNNIRHFRDYIQTVILDKCEKSSAPTQSITYNGTEIHFNSSAFFEAVKSNPMSQPIELDVAIPLNEKEPTISLFEDGVKTREYRLETKDNEDFTGKYFRISVRISMHGEPKVPIAQIDGFVTDTPEKREMKISDIGYRMEVHFLACGGDASKQRYEMIRGKNLYYKALKSQGSTIPGNVRLVGICPDCGKSFCFNGYAFYMVQSDIAYSDDGLSCCEITAYDFNKDTWSYETDGKKFRYYNSFACPHCKTPYIDYKQYPEMKVFGEPACVLLGSKVYKDEPHCDSPEIKK